MAGVALAATVVSVGAFASAPEPSAAAPQPSLLHVGDSLGVGTNPPLRGALRGFRHDSDVRVGRSSAEGVAVLRARLRPRHRIVVFDLGTNDGTAAALQASLRAARAATPGRTLIVPTVNRPGARSFNRAIRSFAAARPGTIVVRWRAAARRRGLLAPDGIHATVAGYAERAHLIAKAARRALKDR